MRFTETFDTLDVVTNNTYSQPSVTINDFVFTNTGDYGLYNLDIDDELLFGIGGLEMTAVGGGAFTFHGLDIRYSNLGYTGRVSLYGNDGLISSQNFAGVQSLDFGSVSDVTRVVFAADASYGGLYLDNIETSPNVASNIAPTITGLASDLALVPGASALDLSSVLLADADGDNLTLTLEAGDGTLSATSGGGVTVGGSGTDTLTLQGGAAALNTFLDGGTAVSFDSGALAQGNDVTTLTLTANDGTGDGTPLNTNIDLAETPSLIVTTALDVVDATDGLTSLREALALANDATAGALGTGDADNDGNANDTITFSNTLAGQTITLGGTQLELTSDITIDGDTDADGDADITVSGNDASRVFGATSGTSTLDALTITGGNGSGGAGGGIHVDNGAALTINASTITGNNAASGTNGSNGSNGNYSFGQYDGGNGTNGTDGANGGGIFVADGGTLTVTDSAITNNTSGAGGNGGNGGSAAFEFGSFYGNGGNGGDGGDGGDGGSIYGADGSTLNIIGTTFVGNAAGSGGSGGNGGGSGNGYNSGSNGTSASQGSGGAISSSGTATVTHATITGNTGLQGAGISATGTTSLTNSIVLGNANSSEISSTITATGSVTTGSVDTTFATVSDGAGVLGDNGGPVQTVALATSPDNAALDTGTAAVANDLTGAARNFDQSQIDNGGTADAGALELRQDIGLSLIAAAAGERLTGSAATDTITGLEGRDVIAGGAGGDTLSGGDGNDRIDYKASASGITVDLNADGLTGRQAASGGDAQGDILTSFEHVTGTGFDDSITGNEIRNNLVGGDGTDTVDGRDGNDQIMGGSGADILIGGDGTDRIIYRDSATGVTVSLIADGGTGLQSASGGSAQGDVISGFEGILGSRRADVLGGNESDNCIDGHSGADIINGLGGNDRLSGSIGNDTVSGGEGNDRVSGGIGRDSLDGGNGTDFIDYRDSRAGTVLDLTADGETGLQSASGGDAEGDTIRDFENVFGSAFADAITGDDGRNDLFGDGGDDALSGGGGSDRLRGELGNDTLTGGGGSDRFIFSDDDGDDVILDFTAGRDSILFATSTGLNFEDLTITDLGSDVYRVDYNTSEILVTSTRGALEEADFGFLAV